MMESIVAAAMNCDAAQKYYYILIVVAVISWMDENNFHIIENNLSALFTFIHVQCLGSIKDSFLLTSQNFDCIGNFF